MNYKKIILIFTFYIGLSSSTTFCYTFTTINQQVNSTLNKWFNKTTLITGSALVGSALLSVVLYKTITQWVFNHLNRNAQQAEENPEIQEIPYIIATTIMEELTSHNYDQNTIQKLRKKNQVYKNYLDVVLTDHYHKKIQDALQGIPKQEREQWIDGAQNFLIRSVKDETTNGSEFGRLGTKMKALQRISNPLSIDYYRSKPYQTSAQLLLSQ